MSRTRSVAWTTRLAASASHPSNHAREGSAWKYSSTSNVNALFIGADLSKGRIVGLPGFGHGMDDVRESGGDRGPAPRAQELGGANGQGLRDPGTAAGSGQAPAMAEGPGAGSGWTGPPGRRGLPRADVDRCQPPRCRRGGDRSIHGIVNVGEVASRRGIGIHDRSAPAQRVDERRDGQASVHPGLPGHRA